MDFIQATNTPVMLELGGAKYKVRTLNFRELAPLSAWIEEHVPSPLDSAMKAIGRFQDPDPRVEETLLEYATNAMLSWPPRPGTKTWFDALDGADGGLTELVYTILSKTIPNLDRAKAESIKNTMTVEEFLELVYLGVMGVRPKKGEDVPPEPALKTEPAPVTVGTVPEDGWGPWRE